MDISFETPNFDFTEIHCENGKFISKNKPDVQPDVQPWEVGDNADVQPDGNDADFWIDRGFRLLGLNPNMQYGDVIPQLEPVCCFNKALEKKPKSMRAYDGKVTALLNAAMIGEAQDVIAEALDIDRYYPSIWYLRASLAGYLNDHDDEKYCYEFLLGLESLSKKDNELVKQKIIQINEKLNQSK